jgi:hypothetical protein
MSRTKISRRAALGVFAKTGAALGAGTFFFLSLKTSRLADAAEAGPQGQAPLGATEKVMIGGAGSKLTVKISGVPGRYCGLSYATTDAQDHYRAVPNARGIIGKDGTASFGLNVKDLPEGKVYLRIVTGRTSGFDEDIAGTEAFVVNISKGQIEGFEGLKSRPLENAKSIGVAVASMAAACAMRKK